MRETVEVYHKPHSPDPFIWVLATSRWKSWLTLNVASSAALSLLSSLFHRRWERHYEVTAKTPQGEIFILASHTASNRSDCDRTREGEIAGSDIVKHVTLDNQ